jgi:hypothetical protein
VVSTGVGDHLGIPRAAFFLFFSPSLIFIFIILDSRVHAAAFVESYYQLLDHYNLMVRVDSRFAYLGREGSVTYEELGHLLRMKEADIKKNFLYDALRRGIGMETR